MLANIAQYALGLVGTVVSWCLLGRYGRRTIHLTGLGLLAFVLVICGIVAVAGLDHVRTGWIEGSLLLLYTLVYGCTIGPVTYALVSEMSSTRTKSKTINIARMGYNAFGVFNCIVTPYQLNPTALDWGGKTAWFWFGFCALCFVYSYFRIPEPRNRTYAEMDWLFANKVSARRFAKTHVPKFGEGSAAVYEEKPMLVGNDSGVFESGVMQRSPNGSDSDPVSPKNTAYRGPNLMDGAGDLATVTPKEDQGSFVEAEVKPKKAWWKRK